MPLFVYKLAGIGLIFLIVGGTIYGGYRYVVNLQEQVVAVQKENLRLNAAIDGLEQEIKEQKIIAQDRQKEIDQARTSDTESRSIIHELEIKLSDQKRQEREQNILNSRKASLYLRFVQKYEECLAQHFDDFSGKCNFKGTFVPNEALK